MIKLAICIPCYGDTKAKFTLSLSNAIIHFLDSNISDSDGNVIDKEVEMFMVSCSMLTESRHRLVAEALTWGATHMLWLDADHVFPKDTIPRLLMHNKDVVGANYARRNAPTAPTAVKTVTSDEGQDNRNLLYTTLEKAEAGELEECDHLGFGVCMVNMRVFDKLQIEADKGDGNILPLFEFKVHADKIGLVGEDVFFFNKVRQAGGEVYCDHGLSWEVGHIHEQILTNAHADRQKDAWEKFTTANSAKIQAKIEGMSE
jgi:hypothetical protein